MAFVFLIQHMGFFNKLFGKKEKETLDEGLKKTKEGFLSKITKAIAGKSTVDEEVLDNLEEALVGADVGIETTVQIIDRIEKRVAKDKYMNASELNGMLQEEIELLLTDAPESNSYAFDSELPVKPYIILVVGVNGVGKTTTIGKLAYNFKKAGKEVLLGAADTFRAAAVEQLTRYIDQVDRNPAHAPARGVLIAPDLAPQARVLLEARGYDFVALDEVLERCSDDIDLMRLF